MTFASTDELHARAALTEAERARLNGTGSDQDVAKGEKALAAAKRAATADVSAERLAGRGDEGDSPVTTPTVRHDRRVESRTTS